MKDLAGKQVSNEIFKLIDDALFVDRDTPYLFIIYGVDCKVSAYNNANSRYEKIKKWAERNHSEVKIISRPLAHKILVEITDPIAAYLEKHLANK